MASFQQSHPLIGGEAAVLTAVDCGFRSSGLPGLS